MYLLLVKRYICIDVIVRAHVLYLFEQSRVPLKATDFSMVDLCVKFSDLPVWSLFVKN